MAFGLTGIFIVSVWCLDSLACSLLCVVFGLPGVSLICVWHLVRQVCSWSVCGVQFDWHVHGLLVAFGLTGVFMVCA